MTKLADTFRAEATDKLAEMREQFRKEYEAKVEETLEGLETTLKDAHTKGSTSVRIFEANHKFEQVPIGDLNVCDMEKTVPPSSLQGPAKRIVRWCEEEGFDVVVRVVAEYMSPTRHRTKPSIGNIDVTIIAKW